MNKKKIEKILYDYPVLKSQIEMKIVDVCSDCEISAISYEDVGGGKTNNVYSSVEDLIMTKIEKEEELSNMIAKKKKIEASLRCLNTNEIKVIQMKYFEESRIHEIAYELVVSEATVYRLVNSAIDKLEKCGLIELIDI